MVLIMIYFICTSNQSGKFQVKYMTIYIEPLIDEILKLWNGITMYDVSRPIQQRKFQFHDAPGLSCMDNTRCPWVIVYGQYTMPLGSLHFVVCNFKFHFNCI